MKCIKDISEKDVKEQKISRVADKVAKDLVDKGVAVYIHKQAWKKARK